jgi:hypothetical protein
MTPLEALQHLEGICARVGGDREFHVRIMEAAKIVGAALMDQAVQKKIAHESDR